MLKTPIGRTLLTAAVVIIVAAIGIVVLVLRTGGGPEQVPTATGGVEVVRPDSHRLDDPPDATATFVEFLDFECEGCRAAYPIVEQLRTEYGDRVEFVLRYFPLPGHVNAERAARAVEAAARQGRLEAMYRMMYETQSQWGERRTPADAVFRGFAEELGLDMARFDSDYADPETAARVRRDVEDGVALGVQGTPTFFIDGQQIPVYRTEDLREALERALD
ncbi:MULTISPECIES: DsbA family protein [Mycobacteriaceae]|uniref:DsbA family protein n=1 Tax=Mycobacteriaceae TaxID=1762 RepID=UPI0002ED5879|nr:MULTISPECIES: thioredoxin domain-containing protein [Mycobacteriaceae]WBP96132.1 thioredoxin domain-containing protein [Mycolicibacterium neoaurum]WBS09818.1 thioredoxin domain-containing protein [Mycolicibacterium neoaurum]